ncbi:MAG: hypothetical protein ACIAQZ_10780 [Sedimentisphaeraceae bacterium JB056]
MGNKLGSHFLFNRKLYVTIGSELFVGVLFCLFLYEGDKQPNSDSFFKAIDSTYNNSGNCWLQREFISNGRHYELEFSASDLTVKNHKLSFFSSYMNRVVNIEDLVLMLNCKSPKVSDQTAGTELAEALVTKAAEVEGFASILGGIFELDFDTSNVFSVFVSNFDCYIEKTGMEFIRVSSRRASITGDDMKVLLEGGAEVNYISGQRLRANKIEWDIKNDKFIAHGPSMISMKGEVTTGRDLSICCR